MRVTKNPQNVHRKYFWTILVTFIFDVKLDINICESYYVNLLVFVNLLHSPEIWLFWHLSTWHLFDNLTSFWHFDIFLTFWHLFDILTSCWHFDIFFNLNHLSPSQGYFLIDMATYVISVLLEKLVCMRKLFVAVVDKPQQKITIRQLAKIIGKIVSLFLASLHTQLHYRMMECFKIKAPKANTFYWGAKIHIQGACLQELQWWAQNVSDDTKFCHSLHCPLDDVELFTDACDYDFSHMVGMDSQQGLFTDSQRKLTIITKELLTIYYGLFICKSQLKGKHVLVRSDSVTALSCLKKRGSQDANQDWMTNIWDHNRNYLRHMCHRTWPFCTK